MSEHDFSLGYQMALFEQYLESGGQIIVSILAGNRERVAHRCHEAGRTFKMLEIPGTPIVVEPVSQPDRNWPEELKVARLPQDD